MADEVELHAWQKAPRKIIRLTKLPDPALEYLQTLDREHLWYVADRVKGENYVVAKVGSLMLETKTGCQHREFNLFNMDCPCVSYRQVIQDKRFPTLEDLMQCKCVVGLPPKLPHYLKHIHLNRHWLTAAIYLDLAKYVPQQWIIVGTLLTTLLNHGTHPLAEYSTAAELDSVLVDRHPSRAATSSNTEAVPLATR